MSDIPAVEDDMSCESARAEIVTVPAHIVEQVTALKEGVVDTDYSRAIDDVLNIFATSQ